MEADHAWRVKIMLEDQERSISEPTAEKEKGPERFEVERRRLEEKPGEKVFVNPPKKVTQELAVDVELAETRNAFKAAFEGAQQGISWSSPPAGLPWSFRDSSGVE